MVQTGSGAKILSNRCVHWEKKSISNVTKAKLLKTKTNERTRRETNNIFQSWDQCKKLQEPHGNYIKITIYRSNLASKSRSTASYRTVSCVFQKPLISVVWMLRARPVHFEPLIYAALVINAKTRQTGDVVPTLHIFKTNHAFTRWAGQDILIVADPWLC